MEREKKLNVLFVTEYFIPHWTGIVKAFFYLVKEIQSQGHSVTVLTTQYEKTLTKNDTMEGIKIIRSPYIFKLSRTHYSPLILSDLFFNSREADVIFINSPNSNILFITILAKLLKKKIAIYHQGDLILPRMSGSPLIHFCLERLFDCLTLPSMVMSHILSTDTVDYAAHSRLMKYFLYKFQPFVPPVEFSKREPHEGFRKKLSDIKKEHVLIGFAGRFVEEKGFDILFKAITLVIREIPQARFIFAGQKKMSYEAFFDTIKPLIDKNKEYIIFLGLLEESELVEFYRNLEVFVVSSRSDCFPVTQIEAAVSGIPLVTTDIPGARMLVKETGFGEIVKPEDPRSLAEGILKVIKNRDRYMKYSVRVGTFLDKYKTFNLNAQGFFSD